MKTSVEPGGFQQMRVRVLVRCWNFLGQSNKTLQVWDDATAQWPQWDWATENRAFALAQNGRAQEAADTLCGLVQRSPQRASAWFNLGFLLQQQADPVRLDGLRADAALEQATVLDARNDRAWYGLGLERVTQGRLDEAVVCFKHCTRLQPMSPYAWYQLARVHHARGEMESAGQILAHLKTFDPKISNQLQRELATPAAGQPA
jgi:tetratricopeptide (TPR) repeat protein